MTLPKLSPLAIQLLRKTQESIMKEPKRYDQYRPCATCDSPGCICGWMNNHAGRGCNSYDATDIGLTEKQEQRLFHASYWPDSYYDQYMDNIMPSYKRGSPEAAAVAIARIDHFINTDGEE